MTRKTGDQMPEPEGGRAAERLREFIDQRFPGGMPTPESVQGSEQSTGLPPDQLVQALRELIETQKQLESRLDQLEQTVQKLADTQKRTEE